MQIKQDMIGQALDIHIFILGSKYEKQAEIGKIGKIG